MIVVQTMTKASLHAAPKSTFLDYFPRPGDGGILQTPLTEARAAWYGSYLASRKEEWCTQLTKEQASELTVAIKQASTNSIDLSDTTKLSELSVADAMNILPSFVHNDLVPKLKTELGNGVHGRGIHVIRGIPAQNWTSSEQELFFWLLGTLVGHPGVQDADGLLLQHVKDIGADSETARKYKTNAAIDFHCDGADVVGLFCLQTAQQGGTSRIISSVTVYNEFLKQYNETRPDMIQRLYQPFPMDIRSDTISYIPVTPIKFAGNGQLRIFYMKDYFQSVYNRDTNVVDSPTVDGKMPTLDAEVLKAYDDICNDSNLHLDMEFEIGDIQFLNNHVILHSRTAYEDYGNNNNTNEEEEDKDPASSTSSAQQRQQQKRDLLRLWLSMPEEQRQGEDWKQTLSRKMDTMVILARVLWSKIRYQVVAKKK